jgi:hypothetical protein
VRWQDALVAVAVAVAVAIAIAISVVPERETARRRGGA